MLETTASRTILSHFLHTQKGLNQLSKFSLLDTVSLYLTQSFDIKLLPLMSCSYEGARELVQSGIFDKLHKDYVESEKGRLMIWLNDQERTKSEFSNIGTVK